jgi:transcriptional regulator with XRE-family HTH domain
MNNIGFKIKKLREDGNISQEELAHELDISQSNLSRMENNSIEKIDFLIMHKICVFFNVEPYYFLEDTLVNQKKIKVNNGGVIAVNNGVFNNFPEGLLKNVMENQQQLTELINNQNLLLQSIYKK